MWLRRLLLGVLLVSLAVVSPANAQANYMFVAPATSSNPFPSYANDNAISGKTNNGVARVVGQRADRLGIPANDNRRAATLSAIGRQAQSRVGFVKSLASAGRAIPWAALVLGALEAASSPPVPIAEAGNGAAPFTMAAMAPDEAESTPMGGEKTEFPPLLLVPEGQAVRRLSVAANAIYSGSPRLWGSELPAVLALARFQLETNRATVLGSGAVTVSFLGCALKSNIGPVYSCLFLRNAIKINGNLYAEERIPITLGGTLSYYGSSGYETCAGGQSIGTGCVLVPLTNPPVRTIKREDAYEIPPVFHSQPITPQTMRTLVDDLWKSAAAQSDYVGVPWSPTDPVTDADVEAVRANWPSEWPNLGDLMSKPSANARQGAADEPVSIPWNVTSPIGSTGYVPEDGTAATPAPGSGSVTNNITNNTTVDLGPNPNAPPPTLETPSAASIIAPLFNIFNFELLSVPTGGQCPTDTMTVFGETYTLDAHCSLIEEYRSLISGIFLAIWPLTAFMIILRA